MLLSGSHKGVKLVAIIFSLAHGQAAQRGAAGLSEDVLANISAHPHHKLAELLPQNWINPVAK